MAAQSLAQDSIDFGCAKVYASALAILVGLYLGTITTEQIVHLSIVTVFACAGTYGQWVRLFAFEQARHKSARPWRMLKFPPLLGVVFNFLCVIIGINSIGFSYPTPTSMDLASRTLMLIFSIMIANCLILATTDFFYWRWYKTRTEENA